MPSTRSPTSTESPAGTESPTGEELAAINAAQAAETIPVLRGQIDGLDEAIVRLVAERAKLSTRIQTARMNAGGTRVELGRERVIRAAFRDGLGPDGPELADAILQVCRGRR